MPRKKSTKDPFEIIGREYIDAVTAMDEKQIRDRIASVSLDQVALMEARDQDLDLQKAVEQAREAGATYREGTKINKLKIAFAKRVLEDRGKV